MVKPSGSRPVLKGAPFRQFQYLGQPGRDLAIVFASPPEGLNKWVKGRQVAVWLGLMRFHVCEHSIFPKRKAKADESFVGVLRPYFGPVSI